MTTSSARISSSAGSYARLFADKRFDRFLPFVTKCILLSCQNRKAHPEEKSCVKMKEKGKMPTWIVETLMPAGSVLT